MDAFEEDDTEAGVGAYTIDFEDYKAKVARAHHDLDMRNKVTDDATPKEGEREEGRAKATEEPKSKVTLVEDLVAIAVEVPVATIGVDTYKVFVFHFVFCCLLQTFGPLFIRNLTLMKYCVFISMNVLVC